MRLAFRVAYIGDYFFGSQMQPGVRTVEGVFIAACTRLDLFDDWRSARFSCSGRTDRGVSARGQVCAFCTDHPERAVDVLNVQLPPDCWCSGWAEVPATFHPRYDARERTYRYYLQDGSLDEPALDEAAAAFVGTHDFSRFARAGDRNPIRTIRSARCFREGGFRVFEVRGESFLWNMVRCMAWALIACGKGDMTPADIASLLDYRRGDRMPAAPPEGLVLWDVDCGITFRPMALGPRRKVHLEDQVRGWVLRKKIVGELCGPGLDL
ncbi:MAG TPA: tRNA pseudouridine(38-40) synthase TruA [Methanoculleus sp.]|nr:tRNA pseudouridine(38-40) synthase TruA [Methanoculleus sp.]